MWRQAKRKQPLPTLLDTGNEMLLEAIRLRERGGWVAACGGVRCHARVGGVMGHAGLAAWCLGSGGAVRSKNGEIWENFIRILFCAIAMRQSRELEVARLHLSVVCSLFCVASILSTARITQTQYRPQRTVDGYAGRKRGIVIFHMLTGQSDYAALRYCRPLSATLHCSPDAVHYGHRYRRTRCAPSPRLILHLSLTIGDSRGE